MAESDHDDSGYPKSAIYILGAGFSAAAGLPLAPELWREVLKRAPPIPGRAEKFTEDLDDYIEFRKRADGVTLKREDVNFEEFLGFLDIEHYLGLRGSETWSEDGNETQVIVKTLIGQILTERTPAVSDIPELYLRFAAKLQPGDRVLTFNYDVLLERALEKFGKPYRLGLSRYKSVHGSSATLDDASYKEIVILKMHGSLDWFDRRSHHQAIEEAERNGLKGYVPTHPVFNGPRGLSVEPLVAGPRHPLDTLGEVHRVRDIERFYADPPWFLATPRMLAPSTQKVVYAPTMGDLWRGSRYDGGYASRLVVIGYSLPPQDEYARQVIYRILTNFQETPPDRIHPKFSREKLMIVSLCRNSAESSALRERYRFLDWCKTRLFADGFNDAVVDAL